MIGGPLNNTGTMPIDASAGPATSGANGQSSGVLTMGNINMGGGMSQTTVIALVIAVLVVVWLWKKK